MPEVGPSQLQLLEKLCNAVSVSGDEYEVRQIVLEEIKLLADDVKVDALGNVLATKYGRGENRVRVMLDAHMDEIGFMIVKKHDDGLFQFETVGGIDVRQLPGKSVLVGRDHLPGVIGAKPIHMTTASERKNKIPLSELRIDLGPEIGEKVQPGDWATFATQFEILGPSIKAKALDDRFGVATLIELLKHAPENIDLLLSFSVQEEVGLRGARVAAYAFNPDMAIAVDSTPAYDLPAWDHENENTHYNTRLDAGPAIYPMDGATIADQRLGEPACRDSRRGRHPLPDPAARRRWHRRRRDPQSTDRRSQRVSIHPGTVCPYGSRPCPDQRLGEHPAFAACSLEQSDP